MLKIGSHVSMSGKDMLLGSVNEALSYGATTFMFYTGAPQNTARKPVSQLKVEEAKAKMAEAGLDIDDLVVHAPYIINLANTIKEETFELAVRFLTDYINGDKYFKINYPGHNLDRANNQIALSQDILDKWEKLEQILQKYI